MTISRRVVLKDVLPRTWRAPILRVLASGPKGYAEIRAGLIELEGHSPGDGYISTELRELKTLRLLEQRDIPGKRRPGWALTRDGETAVAMLDKIEELAEAPAHDDTSVDLDGGGPQQKGLSVDQIQARALKIDTTTAHPARRYNYLLGGKDNFEADRKSAEEFERVSQSARVTARENRAFLQRAVTFLAAEAGITRYLDIGTGLPTADNTHEVAQRVNPRSRVVYVDNDPMVMVHARALLTSTPEGRSYYLEEDLRNPDRILNHPEVKALLDSDEPIALMLVAVLHFVKDHPQARSILEQLIDALPSGSYLAASHMTIDFVTPEQAAQYHALVTQGKIDAYARSREQFTEFFTGLNLVEPGITPVSDWRSPVPVAERPDPQRVAAYAGVGRKP